MTERINVETKTMLNRLHAGFAFIFWIAAGVFITLQYSSDYDYAWLAAVIGIVIGFTRMFIINNKYAWQVATLEEIRDIKVLLEKEHQTPSISSISTESKETKDVILEENHQ